VFLAGHPPTVNLYIFFVPMGVVGVPPVLTQVAEECDVYTKHSPISLLRHLTWFTLFLSSTFWFQTVSPYVFPSKRKSEVRGPWNSWRSCDFVHLTGHRDLMDQESNFTCSLFLHEYNSYIIPYCSGTLKNHRCHSLPCWVTSYNTYNPYPFCSH
jgi:hypothetical protein